MSVATFGTRTYIVPLVTEWQVLYYRKDLLAGAGIKVPANFVELEAAARQAQFRRRSPASPRAARARRR